MIILSFCFSFSGFSQDPKNEENLKLLAESGVSVGEYEVQKTSQLHINGEPFIKLDFDPKFKSGLNSSLLEKKNPTYLCQSDDYKLLGDPFFKTTYVALNIGSSIMAYNQMKAVQWDKAKHFYAGYIIGNVTSGGFQLLLPKDTPHRKLKIFMAGVIASAVVGTAKEVRDSYGYGNPEAKDAFATLLGGVGGSITFSLVDLKKH